MSKRITINEIAKLAGVSKATISHYLNGNYSKMSLNTKEKIRLIIQETHYIPNKLASSLATSKTKLIGVVISDITNPFIASVIKGIHDSCTSSGYSMMFTNSNNNQNIEKENIKHLYQQNVSGIILDSTSLTTENLAVLNPNTTVLVDKQEEQTHFDTIISDNTDSTKVFLKLMKEAGYTDLYFVTFPLKNVSTRNKRYKAFKEVVSTDPQYLITIDDLNKEYLSELILKKDSKPAFFTMNGPVLLLLMKLLNQLNFHYPDDFGLGTYENLNWMEILNPPISCIAQDSYQIGYVAAKHLINKIEGNNPYDKATIIEVENSIILRNSF